MQRDVMQRVSRGNKVLDTPASSGCNKRLGAEGCRSGYLEALFSPCPQTQGAYARTIWIQANPVPLSLNDRPGRCDTCFLRHSPGLRERVWCRVLRRPPTQRISVGSPLACATTSKT